MENISVQELRSRIEAGESIVLIDVREPHEHDAFNIGGKNLPLGGIVRWSEQLDVPVDSEIVVYCRTGNRSGMAQSYLTAKGYTAVKNLTGGVVAWVKMES